MTTTQTRSARAKPDSAWFVHERFGHPVVRSFLLWLAFATIQDPARPGTGALPGCHRERPTESGS